MHWILYVLLIALLVYLVIAVVYYFLQERLLFVARPLTRKHKFELATPFEEVFLESEEGDTIHAIHIKISEPKGLILYFHGNTGNMQRWAAIAEELTTFGFDVLVVDYRGFGKSSGKRNEANLHSDAQEVYDHALTLCDEKDLVVYGRSLGAGMAVQVAARNKPAKLVLETPFFNLNSVVFHHFPFLPVRLILKYKFRNDRWIKKVRCPLLIAHGTKDRLVPYKFGLRLFDLVSDDPKNQMLTINRGKHSDLGKYALFREKMNEFLSELP